MLYEAKKKNELALSNKKMKDKLQSDPSIYDYNYLDKSEIPLPELKFKHKADLVKMLLDKPSIEDREANIVNISLKDPFERITCVEISRKAIYSCLGLRIQRF